MLEELSFNILYTIVKFIPSFIQFWININHCSARVARNSAQAELRATPRTLEAKSRNYYTLWVGVIPSIKCLETLVE